MANIPPKKFVEAIPNVQVGTPVDPPPQEHLSEKERSWQGYPYRPWDPELVAHRRRAHDINRRFNDTPSDAVAQRREIINEYFHPDCKDRPSIYIEPPFRCDYGYNVRVGNNFYANWDCVILDSAPVDIGDDCLLAPGVHMYTATHPVDPVPRREPNSPTYYELAFPIKIGNTCWIGGRSVICPGVTIGDNVVVGAGSVVTKDVPSNVVVAGNPAKIIRYLDGAEVPPHIANKNKK
ncbi:maltose O-acetyltransferase [Folsomia candida]|uniref:Maltose O-acetyltransferase n=1 Tax=Folsomia candida TaxID=158441 RepID=A0A226DFK2_FOLCA|nr:maltose O-acetyltransferase [Folsomia candida]XP_035714491.1 maltose O-acetyltransferase [Folsomia candida]OXA43959.1 Maltose O-acetyltransferase [Folsomia candida]